MKKLLYITHLSGKRLNRFWLSSIEATRTIGYEFHLACNMSMAEHPEWEKDCKEHGVITHQIDFNRNPLSYQNLRAKKQLRDLLSKEGFDIVHCNTPVGGLIGRVCAKKEKVPHVIYQAHGFHFWHGAKLRNWILYYPVERWLAHKTDTLITINHEDYERAKKFKAKRVVYIPGVGIDTNQFNGDARNRDDLRAELGIPDGAVVILSVGELIKRKNHKIVIKALKKLDHVWYVICGQGPKLDEYKALAKKYGVDNRIIFAGYRTDVKRFYDIADLFVLPSYQEGLSVALMEAMASGLPCVVSNIRGNTDLIDDEDCWFTPDDIKRLVDVIQSKIADKSILKSDGIKNRIRVENYRIEEIVDKLIMVYRTL